jgi:hypothetical protein
MSCDANERLSEWLEEQFYEEHGRYPTEDEEEEMWERFYD